MASATGDALSTYQANIEQQALFGGVAWTPPATLYLRLYTSDPTDSGTGGTEVTGGSYAALAVTNNSTNFVNDGGGTVHNGIALTFPTATANWGTISHYAWWDAATGGNMRWHDNLRDGSGNPTTVAINTGQVFSLAIGTLVAKRT